MKILITGGSGFVGTHLTRRLIKEGHQVTITTNGSEPKIPNVFKTLYTGLGGIDWNFIEKQDLIFHLMANNDTMCEDKLEMSKANLFDPMRLFYFAKRSGCRNFIYASSTAVYGNSDAPYDESTDINPLNAYAQSKADFDEFAMSFAEEEQVNVTGLRYCNIYGPGEEHKEKRMSMIGQIINQIMLNQKPKIFKNGEQKRDWVYVSDVIEANVLAMNNSLQNKGGIYNIGSGQAYTFNEICKIVFQTMSKIEDVEYIDCPFNEKYQNHTECNIEKARRELNFSPSFNLQSGIQKYINYFLDPKYSESVL